MAMIDKPPLRQPAMSGPSIAQPRILCGSRSRLEACLALRNHADDYGIRSCAPLSFQQFFAKAAWVVRMRVCSNNEGSQIAVDLDGPVDAATLNSTIVGDEGNTSVVNRAFLHYAQCPIRAAAINNDNLAYDTWRLRSKMGDCSFDMLFLVQAWNNDDRRRR
jgi:hypothetical protein